MKTFLGSLLFLTVTIYATAQNKLTYNPSANDTAISHANFLAIEKNYQDEINQLKGKDNQSLLEFYRARIDNIHAMFTRGEILSDTIASKYLGKLTAEIVSHNSILQSLPLQFAISKSAVPNAASYGSGFIAFNAGLLTRFENESQVVFVLCHEIAHQFLRHSDSSIKKYLGTLNSQETKKELKHINKQDYNRRAQLESLNQQIDFGNRRYSRANETQADSLAVVLMSNAHYDAKGALSCLALLDKIDDDTFNSTTLLRTTFNNNDYPFKDKWLEKEEGLLGGHAVLQKDEKLADSLKTHPDCSERIGRLQLSVVSCNNKITATDTSAFVLAKEILPYEIINYYYYSAQYSRCVYYCLELLSKKSGDAFAVITLGKAMNNIYDAQKKHSLNKVIDLPSPYYSSNYNMVLQFIQNLRLNEVAMANYFFLKNYTSALSYSKEYESAFSKSSQLADK
jgi:hypothetical protein